MLPFGVEVREVDLASASAAEFAAIDALFQRQSFVVFREQSTDAEAQVQLVARYAEVIDEAGSGGKHVFVEHDPPTSQRRWPNPGVGRLLFHRDLTFHSDEIHVISLAAEVLPASGGATLFANGAHTASRLTPELRAQVEPLIALHVYDPSIPLEARPFRDEDLGQVPCRGARPVISKHPYGQCDVVTVTEYHVDHLIGRSRDESRPILDALYGVLYDEGNIYRHEWSEGDLLLFDNRVVQHAREDFNVSERRRLRRVAGGNRASAEALYSSWRVSAAG